MWQFLILVNPFVSLGALAQSFAHISDLHYDSNYRVGSSTGGYCRTSDPGPAGKFGYQSNWCDSPHALIEKSLVFLATRKPTVDFVLVTGNLARRTRSAEVRNRTEQMMEIAHVSDLLHALVAEPLPVLPAIGESDLWPESDCTEWDGQFATFLNSTWNRFLEPWMDEKNKESFLKWGCYNVTINGFGVIILNTEFWTSKNEMVDGTVCAEGRLGKKIFDWAEQTLLGYKAMNMKVLLTGNRKYYDESGGNDGYRVQCVEHYLNLSTTYEDWILGHVYGGSHEDSFNLIENKFAAWAKNKSGVVLVSPSVVPVRNPAIRIFEYSHGGDKPNGTLTDYIQYYANLGQANAAAELTYLEEYRATTSYELPDLSTQSWINFFSKLETNPSMKAKYELFRGVSSEPIVPTPSVVEPDAIIGVAFSVTCGVIVVLAGILAWWKCRSFKYKTYEQELAEGLR